MEKKNPKKKRIDIHIRITESSSCKRKTNTTGIPTEIFQIPEICIPTENKHYIKKEKKKWSMRKCCRLVATSGKSN